jgi:hypothetical protein
MINLWNLFFESSTLVFCFYFATRSVTGRLDRVERDVGDIKKTIGKELKVAHMAQALWTIAHTANGGKKEKAA